MTEFFVGDKVRVELPRGYSKRGVFGISVLYATSPESRFESAIGTVTEINPVGPLSTGQFLVDFRPFDNSRLGIPWQAHWFREEWLDLVERTSHVAAPATDSSPRVGAEDSVNPAAKSTSSGEERTPAQEAQEQQRLGT